MSGEGSGGLDFKKYANVFIPLTEFNKLRKCILDLHKLKREVRTRGGEEQHGGGSSPSPQCQSTAEPLAEAPAVATSAAEPLAEAPAAPAVATSAATAAPLTISQLSVEDLIRLVKASLCGQAGAGGKEDEREELKEFVAARQDQNDLVTQPPLTHDGPDRDLVTLPPLGGAGPPPRVGAVAPKDAQRTEPTARLATESVLRHFGVRKRKAVKVLVEAIFGLDRVSLSDNGNIDIDGQHYSGQQFQRLITTAFRKDGLGRVKGAAHFFDYLARTGLIVHVQNKKVVETFSVRPPGANGVGRTSAALTETQKKIFAGEWWQP